MNRAQLIKFVATAFTSIVAVAGVALALFLPVPAVVVNVRWTEAVTTAQRREIERTLSLSDGERVEETTWRYTLQDHSPANIRALVEHDAVADTHRIDRASFRPVDPPPGPIRRVVVPSVVVGAAGAALLAGARILEMRKVVLAPPAIAATLGLAPLLLVLYLVVGLVSQVFRR